MTSVGLRWIGWVCLAGLVGGLPAVAQTQQGDREPLFDRDRFAAPVDETLVEKGREIAKGGAQAGGVGMKCMACHGLDGAGRGTVPRLAGQQRDYLAEQIKAYTNGDRANAIMSPIAARLGPEEIDAVLAYYANLPPPDRLPPVDLDWDLVRAGELLVYAGRRSSDAAAVTACVMCHNAVGDLDEVPVAPRLGGQPAAYIEAQLEAWRSGARRGSPLGVMSQIANAMTQTEIAAAAAYYASLNPAEMESD